MANEESHVRTIDLLSQVEGAASIAIPSTQTRYSKSFLWPNGEDFSISYRFQSTNGTVDVTIEIESGDTTPTTENAADAVNYAVGNTIASNVKAETLQYKAPSPTVSKYCRFKFTGAGSNNADTVCNILKLHYIAKT